MGHEVLAATSRRPIFRASIIRPMSSSPSSTASSARAANSRKFSSKRGLAFVGSGSAASRLGMNKASNKALGSRRACRRLAYRVVAGRRHKLIEAGAFGLLRRQGNRQRQQHRRLPLQEPRDCAAEAKRRWTDRRKAWPGLVETIHQRPGADRRPAGRKAARPDPHRPQGRVLRLPRQVQSQRHRASFRYRACRRGRREMSANSPAKPTPSSALAIWRASTSCSTSNQPVSAGDQHAPRLHPQEPAARSRQTRRESSLGRWWIGSSAALAGLHK